MNRAELIDRLLLEFEHYQIVRETDGKYWRNPLFATVDEWFTDSSRVDYSLRRIFEGTIEAWPRK